MDLRFRITVVFVGLVLASPAGLGQPPSAAPGPDPLMNLMLAQPKIDVDSPVVATATFDPPVVRPGELSVYRVTFNALEESVEWPARITGPPELNLQPGAHGQLLQMIGLNLVPRTSFNYHARALKPGQFVMPGFTVAVYGKPIAVPPAGLEVAASASAPFPPAQRLMLDLSTTNLFVGQAARADILLPGSTTGVLRALTQVQLSGAGIFADLGAARMRVEMMSRPGVGANLPTFIYETTLTPLRAGRISVFAQGFAEGQRSFGPVVIPGTVSIPSARGQLVLLDSDPIELNVRPLPGEGRLPGFTGAIGRYRLGAAALSTNVLQVGDEVNLTIKVLGDASSNLARLVAPPPPRAGDWQVFAATADNIPPQLVWEQGVKSFQFTLIPLTERARATPAIPFSFFDPVRGRYCDLTIPPVPVTVQPGPAPADLQALLQSESTASELEPELKLHDLAATPGATGNYLTPLQQEAWFPFLQLAPGAVFLGLWGWDRRRRHLERHPDIRLRRRARRALRREWRTLRRAARAGDAPRFADAAFNALRVGCAPHYPAEPRALVGSDVLSLLSEADRAGGAGEVVRRVFAVADASRFGTTAGDATALLAGQADLDHVLQQLEERL